MTTVYQRSERRLYRRAVGKAESDGDGGHDDDDDDDDHDDDDDDNGDAKRRYDGVLDDTRRRTTHNLLQGRLVRHISRQLGKRRGALERI